MRDSRLTLWQNPPSGVSCPVCHGPTYEHAEEVDIGVGVQRFIVGYECQTCGSFPVCNSCGVIEFPGKEHHYWCKLVTP
jgi:hypothetical protein